MLMMMNELIRVKFPRSNVCDADVSRVSPSAKRMTKARHPTSLIQKTDNINSHFFLIHNELAKDFYNDVIKNQNFLSSVFTLKK